MIVFSPIFVADKKMILYYNFWVLLIVVPIDFIINVAYIVVTVSFWNKTVTFSNKKFDAFFNKLLLYFVIKKLSRFVIISVAFYNEVSRLTEYESVTTVNYKK